MKRLTTETPDGNFETMLNFVYGKDGWAHIRHDGENADVPLTECARKQCLNRGCDEFPAESAEEIDEETHTSGTASGSAGSDGRKRQSYE